MNKQNLVLTLIDLLKIKSLTGFEQNIKNYILDYIKNIISNDESICIYEKRNNVVVYHKELSKRDMLAFVGHIDTVDNINEYNAKLINDRIYGLGSSDMKSGIAIILNLFKMFYNLNNIIWIFYDQEEGSYINNGLNILFRDLKELLSKIELAIILEPTNNYIEVGCNGVINIEVFIKGKSGHSARPYSYINPFYKLTNLLNSIQNFFRNEFKIFLNDYGINYDKEIIFRSNCVITEIKGMISKDIENKFKNVVPEYAKVNINIRFTPDFDKLKVIKDFNSYLYRIFYGENFVVKVIDYAPAGKIIINNMFKNLVNFYMCYDNKFLYNKFLYNIFLSKGIKVKEAWTDVATFTNQNISALNLGPGDPSLAHTKNEYVLTHNLLSLFEFFVSFLSEFKKINLFY